ncbi:peptidoglycan DD-metalloendopeptidase family protein [Thiosocius teredinicola]|uniref:peptidoglycan DD-metalloendopeptidase family protein n=1 Tax=Thiosocius teredinicola TaxID=1973002 RepID=UPI0013DDDB7B
MQRGDTLYGIAWQKGIDYRLVAAWNGIRPPYRIYPGQTLRLSAPTTRRASSATSHRSSTQTRALPATRPPTRSTATPLPKTKPRTSAKTSPPKKSTPPVAKPTSTKSGPTYLAWAWPVRGKIVSQFNASDPSRRGIKIGGRIGNTIQAAEGGRVVYSGSGLIGYGRLIIIKHNDKYLSAYGHNRKILVKEGDQVTKGQKIAEMGTANNGDALLHFEIRRDGKPVDPKGLLPRL